MYITVPVAVPTYMLFGWEAAACSLLLAGYVHHIWTEGIPTSGVRNSQRSWQGTDLDARNISILKCREWPGPKVDPRMLYDSGAWCGNASGFRFALASVYSASSASLVQQMYIFFLFSQKHLGSRWSSVSAFMCVLTSRRAIWFGRFCAWAWAV